MALFPISGRFIGDFVPVLVAVDTEDTMDKVAKKVAVHTVGKRLPKPKGKPQYEVLYNGEVQPAEKTFGELMAEHEMLPLQWVDVRFKESEPEAANA